VETGQAQQATHQVADAITIHRVNKPFSTKDNLMSKNTNNKPCPQYPENKPSMKEGKISGKGCSNNIKSK
jgi:hypothetical protein